MEGWIKWAQKYLHQTATLHIYSFPNFVLESFISLCLLIVYIFLYVDVGRLCKRWSGISTNAIYYSPRSGAFSEKSSSTTAAIVRRRLRTRAKLRRELAFGVAESRWLMASPDPIITIKCPFLVQKSSLRQQYVEQLLDMTPQQFVKLDKERKLRQINEKSLATLAKNVLDGKLSHNTLERQLETVRESVQCRDFTTQGRYAHVKSASITPSFLDMVEKNIQSNSPCISKAKLKGDMTLLALDAANLLATDDEKDDLSIVCTTNDTASLVATTIEDEDLEGGEKKMMRTC